MPNIFGSTDYYSFKIPFTQSYEPFIITLYYKSPNKDEDMFSPHLFLKNLYFSKNGLFCYLNIESKKQTNFLLYTDDNVNNILNEIKVDNKGRMMLVNDILINSLIDI